jgi:hypothetical protein
MSPVGLGKTPASDSLRKALESISLSGSQNVNDGVDITSLPSRDDSVLSQSHSPPSGIHQQQAMPPTSAVQTQAYTGPGAQNSSQNLTRIVPDAAISHQNVGILNLSSPPEFVSSLAGDNIRPRSSYASTTVPQSGLTIPTSASLANSLQAHTSVQSDSQSYAPRYIQSQCVPSDEIPTPSPSPSALSISNASL